MPQGDKRGTGWEFFDATYDGHWDGELRRGLGQLTDGKVGPENFRMGYYDSERSTYFYLHPRPLRNEKSNRFLLTTLIFHIKNDKIGFIKNVGKIIGPVGVVLDSH